MKTLVNYVGRLILIGSMFFTIALTGCTDETEFKPEGSAIVVYKTPQCGCCDKWVEHMQDAGFNVTVKEQTDISGVKSIFGIQRHHQSCHTAVTGASQFVFEGHIPAPVIRTFLDAPPAGSRGLIVPGMPIGSPGMEQGSQRVPYDVLLLKADGNVEVFAHVDGE